MTWPVSSYSNQLKLKVYRFGLEFDNKTGTKSVSIIQLTGIVSHIAGISITDIFLQSLFIITTLWASLKIISTNRIVVSWFVPENRNVRGVKVFRYFHLDKKRPRHDKRLRTWLSLVSYSVTSICLQLQSHPHREPQYHHFIIARIPFTSKQEIEILKGHVKAAMKIVLLFFLLDIISFSVKIFFTLRQESLST